MRSTIDIDETLLKEAGRLTQVKTKKDLVNLSLRELIRKKRREHLASLFGSAAVDITLEDVERMREDEY
ncbi:MAG: type II toxin-antitoxin system VapB family antitoxin [Chloroflexota bacterium]|nr:type II toxin-antitoxin system VapB family antitoxin [Chloroflexota bacterium]